MNNAKGVDKNSCYKKKNINNFICINYYMYSNSFYGHSWKNKEDNL